MKTIEERPNAIWDIQLQLDCKWCGEMPEIFLQGLYLCERCYKSEKYQDMIRKNYKENEIINRVCKNNPNATLDDIKEAISNEDL